MQGSKLPALRVTTPLPPEVAKSVPTEVVWDLELGKELVALYADLSRVIQGIAAAAKILYRTRRGNATQCWIVCLVR